ncbi:MAG: HAD family phosphatase [Candidatus Aminicenantales bacterium]
MISTIISDFGRVVLWFDNTPFYQKMTAYCSKSVDEIRAIVHRSAEFYEIFDRGGLTPRQFYERAVALLDARIGYDEFVAAYVDIFSRNQPVLDLYGRLKGRYKLMLLSNTDPLRFGFARGKYADAMFFDDYVLSYDVKALKPGPEIFEEAVKRAGVPAASCVFIDDMEENVKGAAALGLKTILYKADTDLGSALRTLGISF